jgi:molybdopterin/thiamine biosynthesis adenylyltransferase
MTTDDLRYSRQITLPAIGATGQQRLGDTSVLIVGMGGLGTPASMYLANSGVGQLLINDFDTVDTSNLPRQVLYRDADTGKPKATAAAECLKLINPNVTTIAMGSRLDRDGLTELTAAVDVVLDCTDNFTSRWLINEVCADMKTPLVSGAAIRWEGQLAVFRHDQAGGPCYRCLYSEADENLNDCAGQGIVAPVAGTVGTMMATEAIKLLLGIESASAGNLWIYDGLAGTSKTIAIPAQPDCPVCSTQAATSL